MSAPQASPRSNRPSLAACLAIGATIAAVVLYFTGLVASNPATTLTRANRGDIYFNALAHGFRTGKLSLDYEVPTAIRQLADPYDPAQRGNRALGDASYYQGRYYLYFGPAPVIVAVIPFQLLTGRDLPLGLNTLLFGVAGYLVLAALWLALWRRYFSSASLSAVIAGLLVLGCCTMVPSVVRRAFIWEMPIAAGFCFSVAAFAAFYFGLHSNRRTRWFLLGSLLLGLAIASRITHVAGLVLPALLLVYLWREGRREGRWRLWPDASWWGPAAGCTLTLGAIGAALLWYNYARFGDPLEFGHNYQLTAGNEGKYQHFSLHYAWYNFRLYFANAVRFSDRFPYLLPGNPPTPKPEGYLQSEWVTAMLPNFPVFLFVLAAPLAVRGRSRPHFAAWLTGIAAYAFAVSVVLLGYGWSADRYMADFLPAWALLAGVGLLAVDAWSATRSGRRNVARALCAILVLVSVVTGIVSGWTTHRSRPAAMMQRPRSAAAWISDCRLAPPKTSSDAPKLQRHAGLPLPPTTVALR